jgi:gliding motility-associated-like protein
LSRKSVLLAVFAIGTAFHVGAQSSQSSFQFIENKGQWDKSVQFRGELFSAEFYTQKKGFTVALHNPKDMAIAMGMHTNHGSAPGSGKEGKTISYKDDLSGRIIDNSITVPGVTVRSHAYSVEFLGANENAQPVPDKQVQSYNNYFIGNDPLKWATRVRIYQAVMYKNVYPNIDVRYYSEDGRLKYDLIINPGGDPSKIALKYTGADKIQVRNNELIVKTSVGDIKELYPYTFQSDNIKGRKEIACKYVLAGNNTVKFQVDNYSKNAVLIIDPSLIFSSFTGSSANQYGFTATPGPDGSLYSGGIVFGEGFPTTPGAYQANFKGGATHPTDIGIMKFSPNGSQRVYATYIGGTNNEYPHSLICDAQGNLVMMGRSYSDDYPGTVEGVNVSGSIIVTKFTADGSRLIGSLIIGGDALDGVNIGDIQQTQKHGGRSLLRNYGDDSRSEVILDGSNNIYVAAQTQSKNFPIRGGGFQSTPGGKGKQDGVVLKINSSCTGIIWSSYLGGPGDDGAFVLDVSPLTGHVFVAGGTTTGNNVDGGTFPGIAAGTIGPAFVGGETDGFVSEISNDGRTLIRSTYIGSTDVDIVYGLKFDRKGFPYIMGTTRGQWQQINALYGSAGNSQFIAKMQPDLSAYVYTTTFGNGAKKPNISPVAFLVDRCENVYISGWGGWIDNNSDPYDQAGIANMPISSDAIQSRTDNRDFYFIVIHKNATQLLYGSYFGQDGGMYGEHVDGGTSRYDQQGVIYQAICANCQGGARFPTTPGVVGPVNGAPDGCNLAAVKIAFNFAGVVSGPESFVNGIHDSIGCAPFSVTLQDTVRNAVSYEWSFADGTPDTATVDYQLNHTFQSVGFYKVRLIAIDSNSCNVRDTAYTFIKVGDDRADLKMQITKQDPCESLSYRFENLSTYVTKPFNDSSFVWDFGDGTRISSGTAAASHAYPQPGVYHVVLTLADTGYCNSPDSIFQDVRVNPLVQARFETPSVGCAPYDAVFVNTSLAGQTFDWDFGDGSPVDHSANPTHTYQNPGQFTIRLTAYDNGTCNKVDDTTMTLIVSAKPTAEFSFTPVVPVQNKPTIFTNLSTGGVRYKWLFGDGDSTIKNTADTTLHQYNATGTYNACLITYNQYDCTDTVCHEVQADILPLLDVPNAFTPGKFGRNSIIRVEGFGIAKMSWKIYNRFGQKVFETNDRRGGWDGTFNGQLQPVDVYGYTLDVQYSDGTKARKKGDITLIR